MDNSAWRGALVTRSDEGEYPDVFNRRATQSAGMHRRAERSDYFLTGPKLSEGVEKLLLSRSGKFLEATQCFLRVDNAPGLIQRGLSLLPLK